MHSHVQVSPEEKKAQAERISQRCDNEQDSDTILAKKFVDQRRAKEYAQKYITDFADKNDQDFEITDVDDPVVISRVMDCLVVMADNAKKHNAAIIIPDYMTSSGNSKLIETALDFVEFDGPVINICTQGQVAVDLATAKEEGYRIKDQPEKRFPRGILHNRVTHSIQVKGSYSRVAARLARVIAEPDLELAAEIFGGQTKIKHKKKQAAELDHDHRNRRIFVVAGGGFAVLQHIAEAVKESIPIVVFQGSRRLSDYLPKLWVRRYSAKFQLYEETCKLCKECGFPESTNTNVVNLMVRDLVEKGNLNIHQVKGSIHALKRVLQSLQTKDDALLQARKRYCDYQCAAGNMERPDLWMLYGKLVFSFTTTLCVTIAGSVLPADQMEKILSGAVTISELSPTVIALYIGIIVLPGILSIIMALQHEYNYGPKILALRHAAGEVVREMFLYRACAGDYSDEKLTEKGKKASEKKVEAAAGQEPAQSSAPAVDSSAVPAVKQDADPAASDDLDITDSKQIDIMSSRAALLTERLIKIGTKVPIFDCPDISDVNAMEEKMDDPLLGNKGSKKKKKKSQARTKLSKLFDLHDVVDSMKAMRGVEHLAEHCLEDWDSESKFGVLSGEDYANMRLSGHLQLFEDEADSLDKQLLLFKISTYAIGVVGGFLSFMSLEVGLLSLLFFSTEKQADDIGSSLHTHSVWTAFATIL